MIIDFARQLGAVNEFNWEVQQHARVNDASSLRRI